MRHSLLLLFGILTSLIRVQSQSSASADTHSNLSTTTPTPEPSPSVSSQSSTHKHTTAHKSTSTIHGGVAPFKTTSSHKTTPTHSHTAPFTVAPDPSGSPSPKVPPETPPEFTKPSSSHQQSGWLIFLEVAGALIGLGFLAALARCFWSYKRTPRYQHSRQDSIQQIRRDLRESRLARLIHRQPLPPPPYEYAPEYETGQPVQPSDSMQSVGPHVTFRDDNHSEDTVSPASAPMLATRLPPSR